MNIPDKMPVLLDDLSRVLARAVRIVVRDFPMMDAETLFESSDRKDLDDLQWSLLLDVPEEPFHCMCIGSPALYLYGSAGELVVLTNHHGRSVRCSLWATDLPVNDTEKWLSWFDHRGMANPRKEVEAERVERERGKRNRDKWLAATPKAIARVWANSLSEVGGVDIAPLRVALEREMPNRTSRILVLLEWFGSGAGPWSGFPFYERAAEELLLGYPTTEIVAAIQSSRIGPAQTEGAARLFGGWLFRQHHPGGLKEVPDALKKLLWNHVKDTEDTDKLNRAARAFADERSRR